jgi:hypothetical protein
MNVGDLICIGHILSLLCYFVLLVCVLWNTLEVLCMSGSRISRCIPYVLVGRFRRYWEYLFFLSFLFLNDFCCFRCSEIRSNIYIIKWFSNGVVKSLCVVSSVCRMSVGYIDLWLLCLDSLFYYCSSTGNLILGRIELNFFRIYSMFILLYCKQWMLMK